MPEIVELHPAVDTPGPELHSALRAEPQSIVAVVLGVRSNPVLAAATDVIQPTTRSARASMRRSGFSAPDLGDLI
jgi:hypothetical protein